MESLIHNRTHETAYGTFGQLLKLDGTFICHTLELNWRNNAHGDWQSGSCIPPGTYQVVPHEWSANPNQPTWEINNVTGRDGILYHPGNTIKDLHGCCCPGLGVNDLGVEQSRKAMQLIADTVGGFDQEWQVIVRYDSRFLNETTGA